MKSSTKFVLGCIPLVGLFIFCTMFGIWLALSTGDSNANPPVPSDGSTVALGIALIALGAACLVGVFVCLGGAEEAARQERDRAWNEKFERDEKARREEREAEDRVWAERRRTWDDIARKTPANPDEPLMAPGLNDGDHA